MGKLVRLLVQGLAAWHRELIPIQAASPRCDTELAESTRLSCPHWGELHPCKHGPFQDLKQELATALSEAGQQRFGPCTPTERK